MSLYKDHLVDRITKIEVLGTYVTGTKDTCMNKHKIFIIIIISSETVNPIFITSLERHNIYIIYYMLMPKYKRLTDITHKFKYKILAHSRCLLICGCSFLYVMTLDHVCNCTYKMG